jgi:hypothetical protein
MLDDTPTTFFRGKPYANKGLDHRAGHFRPLSITRQRHWLAYHFIAMRHEGLCQVF